MLENDPLIREGAVIAVYNATEVRGAASRERAALEEEGYTVTRADNAPEGEYAEDYFVYDLTDGKVPGTIAKLLDRYILNSALAAEDLPEGIDTTGIDIVIILGIADEN